MERSSRTANERERRWDQNEMKTQMMERSNKIDTHPNMMRMLFVSPKAKCTSIPTTVTTKVTDKKSTENQLIVLLQFIASYWILSAMRTAYVYFGVPDFPPISVHFNRRPFIVRNSLQYFPFSSAFFSVCWVFLFYYKCS